jgi:hypothetical protein
MPGRHQHRAQKNRHVVAVAGSQFQHPPRGMQQFGMKNVSGVPDVPLNPFEDCEDFAESIFRPYTVSSKNLDRFLPDVEILRAVANQICDQIRSNQRSFWASWNPNNSDARHNKAVAQPNHSQDTQYVLCGDDDWTIDAFHLDDNIRAALALVVRQVDDFSLKQIIAMHRHQQVS